MQKIVILLGAALAIGYPQWVWVSETTLPPTSSYAPAQVWGLLAFSIMWLHIVAAPFQERLFTLFPRYSLWKNISTNIVLVAILLHPSMMLLGLAQLTGNHLLAPLAGPTAPLLAGLIALPLFLTFDVARAFRRRLEGTPLWHSIIFLSTAAWFLILFHSLSLGSHLQVGPLRLLWYFFGGTATIAVSWRYIINPLRGKKPTV